MALPLKPPQLNAQLRRGMSAPPAPRPPTLSSSGRRVPTAARAAPEDGGLVAAGPSDAAPDYREIDAQPLNRVIYGLFRRRLAAAVGVESPLEG